MVFSKLSRTNRIILMVWIIGTIILDVLDLITTTIPIGQEGVYESNAYLRAVIDIFGSGIGMLLFGSVYKIGYIAFFSIMFVIGCRFIETVKDKSLRKERLCKAFMFGVLYASFLALWLIKIPAIIGNTDPNRYT